MNFSRFSTIILSIAIALVFGLSFIGPARAESGLMETVYFLPKDNVDFAINPKLDYTIVGYSQPIPEEFMLEVEKHIVIFPNDVDFDYIGMEFATSVAYSRMKADLLNNYGIEIGVYDAYRTLKDQQWLIDSGLATFQTGAPGYSEHHTGLMLDIVVRVGEYFYNEVAVVRGDEGVPEEVKASTNFETVRRVMPDYGFIIRFPEGKEEITGIEYLPCEVRFVGSKKIAHEITDNGLCLEEYVAQKH